MLTRNITRGHSASCLGYDSWLNFNFRFDRLMVSEEGICSGFQVGQKQLFAETQEIGTWHCQLATVDCSCLPCLVHRQATLEGATVNVTE